MSDELAYRGAEIVVPALWMPQRVRFFSRSPWIGVITGPPLQVLKAAQEDVDDLIQQLDYRFRGLWWEKASFTAHGTVALVVSLERWYLPVIRNKAWRN